MRVMMQKLNVVKYASSPDEVEKLKAKGFREKRLGSVAKAVGQKEPAAGGEKPKRAGKKKEGEDGEPG